MADQVALAAQPRTPDGKREARILRRTGRVPAIAYGAGLEATSISVDARELYHALHTHAGENVVLELIIEGDKHLAFAREIHRHPVRREVLHLDFIALDRSKKASVEVPIHVEGDVDDGIVTQNLVSLHIEVLPLEVPDSFTVDISGLAIGDSIRAGEIALPDSIDLLTDPDEVVVSVVAPVDEALPEPAAVAAEEAEGATADEAAEIAEQSESGE